MHCIPDISKTEISNQQWKRKSKNLCQNLCQPKWDLPPSSTQSDDLPLTPEHCWPILEKRGPSFKRKDAPDLFNTKYIEEVEMKENNLKMMYVNNKELKLKKLKEAMEIKVNNLSKVNAKIMCDLELKREQGLIKCQEDILEKQKLKFQEEALAKELRRVKDLEVIEENNRLLVRAQSNAIDNLEHDLKYAHVYKIQHKMYCDKLAEKYCTRQLRKECKPEYQGPCINTEEASRIDIKRLRDEKGRIYYCELDQQRQIKEQILKAENDFSRQNNYNGNLLIQELRQEKDEELRMKRMKQYQFKQDLDEQITLKQHMKNIQSDIEKNDEEKIMNYHNNKEVMKEENDKMKNEKLLFKENIQCQLSNILQQYKWLNRETENTRMDLAWLSTEKKAEEQFVEKSLKRELRKNIALEGQQIHQLNKLEKNKLENSFMKTLTCQLKEKQLKEKDEKDEILNGRWKLMRQMNTLIEEKNKNICHQKKIEREEMECLEKLRNSKEEKYEEITKKERCKLWHKYLPSLDGFLTKNLRKELYKDHVTMCKTNTASCNESDSGNLEENKSC